MSTDNVITLPPRRPRSWLQRLKAMSPHVRSYNAILIRDDVSIGELAHALRFSDIVISTDPLSGQTTIHRSPKDAA